MFVKVHALWRTTATCMSSSGLRATNLSNFDKV